MWLLHWFEPCPPVWRWSRRRWSVTRPTTNITKAQSNDVIVIGCACSIRKVKLKFSTVLESSVAELFVRFAFIFAPLQFDDLSWIYKSTIKVHIPFKSKRTALLKRYGRNGPKPALLNRSRTTILTEVNNYWMNESSCGVWRWAWKSKITYLQTQSFCPFYQVAILISGRVFDWL